MQNAECLMPNAEYYSNSFSVLHYAFSVLRSVFCVLHFNHFPHQKTAENSLITCSIPQFFFMVKVRMKIFV
jgi:hypothetical protein